MDVLSINTLRIVLVGLTAIAAIVSAVFGMWTVAGWLTIGVLAHGALWWHLHRRQVEEHDELHRGVEELLSGSD